MTSAAHDAFVAGLPAGGATPAVLPDIAIIRAMRAAEAETPLRVPPDFACSEVRIGKIQAYWVEPKDARPRRTLLYLHGGGYVFLSARHFVGLAAEIARAPDARCLVLEYGRAPEEPFPAALDDAVQAYRWLTEQGISAGDIAIVGDSAGGGLALATLLAIRDRGLPLPAAGAVISPWTDLTVGGASVDTRDDPVVGGASLRMMAETYLAGADPRDPRASPLFADLTGLPPTFVLVGTRESLLDDSRRFAARADASGAAVTLVEYDGVAHMWVFYDPTMPEAVAAFAEIGRFLKARIDIGGAV